MLDYNVYVLSFRMLAWLFLYAGFHLLMDVLSYEFSNVDMDPMWHIRVD